MSPVLTIRSHRNINECQHVHHLTNKHQHNFYQVSQSTQTTPVSMDIFDGLCDQYDALIGAFHREDKKEIDKLGSRESEGYRDQIEGNRSICSRRDELAGGLIPRDSEETRALSLQSGAGYVIAKR